MQLSNIYIGTISVITNVDTCNISGETRQFYDKKKIRESYLYYKCDSKEFIEIESGRKFSINYLNLNVGNFFIDLDYGLKSFSKFIEENENIDKNIKISSNPTKRKVLRIIKSMKQEQQELLDL